MHIAQPTKKMNVQEVMGGHFKNLLKKNLMPKESVDKRD